MSVVYHNTNNIYIIVLFHSYAVIFTFYIVMFAMICSAFIHRHFVWHALYLADLYTSVLCTLYGNMLYYSFGKATFFLTVYLYIVY